MTDRPVDPTTFLSVARTEGELQTWWQQWQDWNGEGLGRAAEGAPLVIAAGSITPTAGVHAIDTPGGAADLSNIDQSNLPNGSLLILRAANAANVPTIKHDAGGAGTVKLQGNADLVMSRTDLFTMLHRQGTTWQEVLRTDGGSGWAFESAPLAIAAGQTHQVAHGLGARPTRVRAVARCVTAEFQFAIGDELEITHSYAASGINDGGVLFANATDLNYQFGNNQPLKAPSPTGANQNLTGANWSLILYASR